LSPPSSARSERPRGADPLHDAWRWLLMLVFGATSAVLIRTLDQPMLGRPALLGLATGSAALLTALVWFAILGARRHVLWLLAMFIPYLNLIAASSYARRYWNEGARAPALLAIAGIVLQTLASLQLLAPVLPALV
jgi:hypothetical protein